MVEVLLADDHQVVRQGLRMFLGLDPEIEVVGEAENGEQALKLARELSPDVVLMDLLMPVMDGIEATRIIREELPEVEVVALTSVLEAASRLMREVRTPGRDSHEGLTTRETEVLRLVAKGKANKQIARSLGLGEATVKTHMSSIFHKLGARSRTQAALYAVREGLVPAEELSEES